MKYYIQIGYEKFTTKTPAAMYRNGRYILIDDQPKTFSFDYMYSNIQSIEKYLLNN